MHTTVTYTLTPAERDRIDGLLDRLRRTYGTAEDPRFLWAARGEAYRHLPQGLLDFLMAFHHQESSPWVVVRGLGVDDESIGPTPPHWGRQADPATTAREELFLALLGCLIGDVFGWSTLQHGHLVHNVLPIRDQEREQSGHGSLDDLAWHTEDGFHQFRCDYLGLMAMRNDGLVPTTVSAVDEVRLSPEQAAILRQPYFLIYPDNEHLQQRTRENGYTRMPPPGPDRWSEAAPSAVLFGDPRQPYLRIDPYYMTALPGNDKAASSLKALTDQLEAGLRNLVLTPGDLAFVDNYRAVHGRRAFPPRYDGRDRWLKKVTVTRDLRKSRRVREGVDGRVLHPAEVSQLELEAEMTGARP
ncbi:guanitoxin biosynthesis L-enduracididine beta-hydroxylase GntD [Nonomuraea basaltis]|uniref:guanitoxin biosynthesis L-enduracididine beta-hydroxylase GntD n=1 Tax=Nonomuraea basaltis TaxID=2495887 RepID=UPI00110C60BB|nr:guanitoxin biosynthesis L-enduracididine beta-hydroxylase GntD [Nonomuraea basaltis]TMR90395.1 hypothetical protein EJK15_55645 [Nonomuraea basaltis]